MRVVVIGGGICGLAIASRLSRRGESVTVLEASDQLGGLGTFFKDGDNWIDRFYHCIMPTDDHLLGLLDDLGIRDRVYWKRTRMGFLVGHRHFAFNTPFDLLRFTPLSFFQRLRLGVVSLLLRRLGEGKDLDNVRTEDWLRGLFGDAIWQAVWKPLFHSKFGDHASELPALYLWQRLGRESNVADRGYPRGGYKTIIDALASSIEDANGDVRVSAPVSKLEEGGDSMTVRLADGSEVEADWVVSTVPLPLLRQMTTGTALEGAYRDPALPYQGVVNALFFLSRPLEGFYWTPVLDCGTEFDGVVEMSALVDTEQFGGRHLVYVMKYTDRESDLFLEPEESIGDRWTQQLVSIYPNLPLQPEDVVDVKVFKAPFVEPAYPLGYTAMKPDFRVAGSRLLLATSAQVYPHITAWNSSVRLAEELVEHLYACSGA